MQSFHFDRDDVALPGLHQYFKDASDEERGHAMMFMKYMNKRGGQVILQDIKAPELPFDMTALDAFQKALDFEKQVNETILEMHAAAAASNDPHFVDFLESNFLTEQVESIKEIGDYVTQLNRVGEGLGVYMFDKDLLKKD